MTSAELLREGERPPRFALPMLTAGPGKVINLDDLLGRRRILLVALPARPDAQNGALAWLAGAARESAALIERDLSVLVLMPDAAQAPAFVPAAPPLVYLYDADGRVAARFGGAPAFYLVGKDGHIKRASRNCSPLKTLFGQIDAMPMRRQEMRERRSPP